MVIVDTNVAMVAASLTPSADDACFEACVQHLLDITENGGLMLDQFGLILEEYTRNLGHRGQPGVGAMFVKWAHNNQGMASLVTRVHITSSAASSWRLFEEFPDDASLKKFDKSDQKFVAVALASDLGPPVLNAVDTDWHIFDAALRANGVNVQFICPQHMRDK